jgi:hypothetical protein
MVREIESEVVGEWEWSGSIGISVLTRQCANHEGRCALAHWDLHPCATSTKPCALTRGDLCQLYSRLQTRKNMFATCLLTFRDSPIF